MSSHRPGSQNTESDRDFSAALMRARDTGNLHEILETARNFQQLATHHAGVDRCVEALELLMAEVWYGGALGESGAEPRFGQAAEVLGSADLLAAEALYRALAAEKKHRSRAQQLLTALGVVRAASEASSEDLIESERPIGFENELTRVADEGELPLSAFQLDEPTKPLPSEVRSGLVDQTPVVDVQALARFTSNRPDQISGASLKSTSHRASSPKRVRSLSSSDASRMTAAYDAREVMAAIQEIVVDPQEDTNPQAIALPDESTMAFVSHASFPPTQLADTGVAQARLSCPAKGLGRGEAPSLSEEMDATVPRSLGFPSSKFSSGLSSWTIDRWSSVDDERAL